MKMKSLKSQLDNRRGYLEHCILQGDTIYSKRLNRVKNEIEDIKYKIKKEGK